MTLRFSLLIEQTSTQTSSSFANQQWQTITTEWQDIDETYNIEQNSYVPIDLFQDERV